MRIPIRVNNWKHFRNDFEAVYNFALKNAEKCVFCVNTDRNISAFFCLFQERLGKRFL